MMYCSDMPSLITRISFLLSLLSFLGVHGVVVDYGFLEDIEPEAGWMMEGSSEWFATVDPTSEVIPIDHAEDDGMAALPISNDCSSDYGDIQTWRKARRQAMCAAGDDYANELPFILPSFLLDVATIDTANYCPSELFDLGSQYLVCSTGFSMDMVDYGPGYQALLNAELGRHLLNRQ
jgi:hypothetical protein